MARIRSTSLFSLLIILSLLLAACAGPVVAPAEAPAAAAPAEAAESSEAAPADEGGLQIAYIPQNTGNPYFERIHMGFQEACEAVGCTVTFSAPATAEATAQIPFIQEQVQRGIDVLAIQPNSVDAINSILDDVRAEGILVITTNNDITGNESHRDAAVISVDFDQTGRQMLDRVHDYLEGAGKFAILSATTDAPAQNKWIEEPGGIKDLLATDPKYADLELLETAYGDDVPQKSLTECEALLTKYPDMDLILAPTTVAVAAAAQCVESAGVYPEGPNASDGGVIVYGLGTPNQMRPFLESGVVKDFDLWDPAKMGIATVYLAQGVKDGTITLGEGNSFEVPGLGTLTFGKDNLIITGNLDTFNADNINDYDF
jgi:rhamnose transport system substrate-binding protein